MVTGGKIQGGPLKGGGAVFKGIPFAAPPVGDLRWREPMPVKPWTGVREATNFGARCMQGGAGVSEDCLYINVWTPEWPSKSRKPVMLWIHGGGNFAGSSSEAIFDGESLARHGVVLVSANYRLGIFGFYEHPELTAESKHHASGNYGLMDQVAALKWVQQNIARFGGDPRNVTIFGESAGALDINVLMTSPLAKGLYARLIGESGPVVEPPSLAEGEKKGLSVAASLKADSLKAMRALPAEDLQKATGQGLSFLGPLLGVVVDGWVVPKPSLRSVRSGAGTSCGPSARNECARTDTSVLSSRRTQRRHCSAVRTVGAARHECLRIERRQGTGARSRVWRCDGAMGHRYAIPMRHGRRTDLAFPGGQSVLSISVLASGARQGIRWSRARERACLMYSARFRSAGRGGSPSKYDATDAAVSGQMQQYWTNFAKTGNPNGGSLPQWPKFDPAARAYMDLTANGPVAREGLRREACDLFIENIARK